MKYFVSILVILILIFSFFGCGTQDGGEESTSVDINEKYSSVIIDSVNNGYGVGIEADYWTGLSFKKKNMKDKSCSVFGNNYSGEYLWSITDKMNPYTTDIYENDDSIQFGFRDDTGDLVLVNLMDDDFFETQPYMPDVPEPYESAIVLATEIAGEYVDDISEYTRIIEEPRTRYKERDGKTYEITYYVITFAKKVEGYLSTDYISVKVTSKGTLASIIMGDINAFEDIEFDFDLDAVTQSISDKVEATYKNSRFSSDKAIIEDQKMVITPNGEVCIYSSIFIDGTDENGYEIKTGMFILTVIGYKNK